MRRPGRPDASGGDRAPRGAPVLVLRGSLSGAIRSRSGGIRRTPGARHHCYSRRRTGLGVPGRLYLPLPSCGAERHPRGLSRVRHGARAADAHRSGSHRIRLSHAPDRGAGCAGKLPGMRHGARTAGGTAGRRVEPGARGHASASRHRRRPDPAGGGDRDERDGPRVRPARPARVGVARMVPGGARHPGGAVVRMAVLRPGLEFTSHAQAQHVHPGGDRHRRRVERQHPRAPVPGHAPRGVPGRRGAAALLRSRRGHRDSGHSRAGAGAPRPRPDRRRHPPPPHSRARHRTTDRTRRHGG